MTRLTFGVSESPFAANMCVKRNAINHALEFPLVAKTVDESFYVDDGLVGADSVQQAIRLREELQERAGFLLCKWNSSEPTVLQLIPNKLRDPHDMQMIPDPDGFTKILRFEWNANASRLVSDIAKTFDVLGWFSIPGWPLAKVVNVHAGRDGLFRVHGDP